MSAESSPSSANGKPADPVEVIRAEWGCGNLGPPPDHKVLGTRAKSMARINQKLTGAVQPAPDVFSEIGTFLGCGWSMGF